MTRFYLYLTCHQKHILSPCPSPPPSLTPPISAPGSNNVSASVQYLSSVFVHHSTDHAPTTNESEQLDPMPTLKKVDEPDGKQDENNANSIIGYSPAPSPLAERLEENKISDQQLLESRRDSSLEDLAAIERPRESTSHDTSGQGEELATTKKGKTSRYYGVCRMKTSSTNPYLSQLSIDGKKCYAGYHRLETDAAFASDKVVSFFSMHEYCDKPTPKRKVNFNSLEEYKDARIQEMAELGVRESEVSDFDALTSKVQSYIHVFLKKKDCTSNGGVVPVERPNESNRHETSNDPETIDRRDDWQESAFMEKNKSAFNGDGTSSGGLSATDNGPISSGDREEEMLLTTTSRFREENTTNHKHESKMAFTFGEFQLSCVQHDFSFFFKPLHFLQIMVSRIPNIGPSYR